MESGLSSHSKKQYYYPVSYTHLDVYKRQLLQYPFLTFDLTELTMLDSDCPETLIPVSYTHLFPYRLGCSIEDKATLGNPQRIPVW